MTDFTNLTPNTYAILLLCGRMEEANTEEDSPLTLQEYNRLAIWLDEKNLSPSDLLQIHEDEQLGQDLLYGGFDPERLNLLLSRAESMATELERWSDAGIWIISQYDEIYPERLKARLGKSAPSILYGSGSGDLIIAGGLAIVGSRDVDEEGRRFTREVAAECANLGLQVISGGARGVDGEAMAAALEGGGNVIGVLGDGLEKKSLSPESRDPIDRGRLLLISPHHPGVGFNAGLAMSRNKLIYALADWALVVNSDYGQGGTWTGAKENLKHNWTTLYVRDGDSVPEGNRKLIGLGARRLRIDDVNSIRTWLEGLDFEAPFDRNREEGGQLNML